MNHYTTYQIRKAAEEFGIPYRLALWHRKRCLQSIEAKLMTDFDIEDRTDMHIHFLAEDIKEVRTEIGKITKEIERLDDDKKPDAITDEMIARAKDYPIEKLIDFDRTGKALAFCHADKTPSLSWWKKGNKATCFPCDKRFDPIDVLILRDGFTFYEAVKRLQ